MFAQPGQAHGHDEPPRVPQPRPTQGRAPVGYESAVPGPVAEIDCEGAHESEVMPRG